MYFKNKILVKKLLKRSITVASIESFTGGLFASTIVSVPNASKIFKGSLITYNNEIKKKIGIDITDGVINKETVIKMAQFGKEYFDVDYCIAFSGNAGPNNMENNNTGQVFIALNNKVYKVHFKGSRNQIRRKAVEYGLILILNS